VDLVLTLLWPKADIAGFLPAPARICRLLPSADWQTEIVEQPGILPRSQT
jgi:hypothetical protein